MLLPGLVDSVLNDRLPPRTNPRMNTVRKATETPPLGMPEMFTQTRAHQGTTGRREFNTRHYPAGGASSNSHEGACRREFMPGEGLPPEDQPNTRTVRTQLSLGNPLRLVRLPTAGTRCSATTLGQGTAYVLGLRRTLHRCSRHPGDNSLRRVPAQV